MFRSVWNNTVTYPPRGNYTYTQPEGSPTAFIKEAAKVLLSERSWAQKKDRLFAHKQFLFCTSFSFLLLPIFYKMTESLSGLKQRETIKGKVFSILKYAKNFKSSDMEQLELREILLKELPAEFSQIASQKSG